jgi:pimeloyl-ACP methyl ester carboxylesterase
MIPFVFRGPALDQGPLPALFYFSLSGEASLSTPPYNNPVTSLEGSALRIFSVDLPFHTSDAKPDEALRRWLDEPSPLPPFFEQVVELIDHLIATHVVDPKRLAVAGLSRGAFVATHIAALEPRIGTILGYAPLTGPSINLSLPQELSLIHLAERLIGRHLLFTIGNRDTQVSTRACYEFVDALTELSFESGLRSPPVELVICPSIGRHGHGTSPETFELGADYIRRRLGI